MLYSIPVGRVIEEQEEDGFAPQAAIVYLVVEKRNHYLGHVTHTDERFVRHGPPRRLKHPSKIAKANVVHVFPHTTDPKDTREIEDRIHEIALKFARRGAIEITHREDGSEEQKRHPSLEDLRRTIQRDANGEPRTILDAVTERLVVRAEQENKRMNDYLQQRNQRSAPPQSNGFARVFDAANAAMIADRLADHLIVCLQRDPNMPRRTRHVGADS
jgi:hypothetical protein